MALYWALHRGYTVETLTFDYYHRSVREIEACKRLANYAKVRNRALKLEFLKEVEDLLREIRNPVLKKAPSSYIPSRNIIFYGIASHLAEITDAKYIVGGHNRNDVASFSDSSRMFFDQFNKTVRIGKLKEDRTGKVLLPLVNIEKSEVVELGWKLGVPFDLTWSCYKSRKSPCGKCAACILRKKAFDAAGIIDPLTVRT